MSRSPLTFLRSFRFLLLPIEGFCLLGTRKQCRDRPSFSLIGADSFVASRKAANETFSTSGRRGKIRLWPWRPSRKRRSSQHRVRYTRQREI